MDRNFGGVIWTNHAMDRMRERGIKQGDAWATWRNPEQSRPGKEKGIWVYYRTYGTERIEVVAKQNAVPAGRQEKREWIILSVWSKQVFQKQPKTPSFWEFIFKRLFHKQ